jgi:hypothetical protein
LPLAVLLSSLLIPTLSTPAWAQICGNGLVERAGLYGLPVLRQRRPGSRRGL